MIDLLGCLTNNWVVSLKAAFPILYNIANVKDAIVVNNMDLLSGNLQWNISFLRLIHDWEVDMVASFYSLLYSFRSRREGEDKLWWKPSRKGTLDVRSYHKIITYKDNPLFLGRAFGRQRLHPKLPSLFGRRRWERFLHWIILGEDKSLWSTGVVFVNWMGSPLITFSFIVR